MEDIEVALVMYDIMCQYRVNFQRRVANSPELSIPSSLELQTGIGLFHIHGHQDSCLPRFSPSYIPGAKQVDGEIIETLWAPLNNISRSLRGMSLMHRQEVLDAHLNHSNWKKLVRIGMFASPILFKVPNIVSQSLHFSSGGIAWRLASKPARLHIRNLAGTTRTGSEIGLLMTGKLKPTDKHLRKLWISMTLSRKRVWTSSGFQPLSLMYI